MKYDLNRNVGGEARRTYKDKCQSGFFDLYMQGEGLDIGFQGYEQNIVPILENCIGVDLGYPGYDGKTLPFQNESKDYVFSSHALEHIEDYKTAIREWFRVTKIYGHIVTLVPHQYLYEKRRFKPSRYNEGHFRFYTPASLMTEIEESLEPNSYRVRILEDGDKEFNYSIPPQHHSSGQYEILLVLQKIPKPHWSLD